MLRYAQHDSRGDRSPPVPQDGHWARAARGYCPHCHPERERRVWACGLSPEMLRYAQHDSRGDRSPPSLRTGTEHERRVGTARIVTLNESEGSGPAASHRRCFATLSMTVAAIAPRPSLRTGTGHERRVGTARIVTLSESEGSGPAASHRRCFASLSMTTVGSGGPLDGWTVRQSDSRRQGRHGRTVGPSDGRTVRQSVRRTVGQSDSRTVGDASRHGLAIRR